MYREARKHGIGIISITNTTPHPELWMNSTLKIITRIDEDKLRTKIAQDLGYYQKQLIQMKKELAKIKLGQCIISLPWTKPTKIQLTIKPYILKATTTKGQPPKPPKPKPQQIKITWKEIQTIIEKLEPKTTIKTLITQQFTEETEEIFEEEEIQTYTFKPKHEIEIYTPILFWGIPIPKTAKQMGPIKPTEPSHKILKQIINNKQLQKLLHKAATNQKLTPKQWKQLKKHKLAKQINNHHTLTTLAWRIIYTLQVT